MQMKLFLNVGNLYWSIDKLNKLYEHVNEASR